MSAPAFGVVFDMDGVLVLSEDAHYASWRETGAARGVEITHRAFLSCFGRVNADCVPLLFGPVAAEESAAIADEKERAYRRIVAEAVPLAPGVEALLDGLRSLGAVLAVGSSAPRENVDLVLDRGGLRPRFTAAVDGGEVRRGKPAPDVFLLAAERLGLPPARCVVVEDAPTGVLAAKAAGMPAVGVATTHAEADLFVAGAAHVAPALADLDPALFARLTGAVR